MSKPLSAGKNNQDHMPKKLKKYRMKAGHTIYSLADKLNVSFSAVSYWENGAKFPRRDRLAVLEDMFGVDWRELFSDMTPEEVRELDLDNHNGNKTVK
jgi:transcriptional regulator with XRE-family HTH domain